MQSPDSRPGRDQLLKPRFFSQRIEHRIKTQQSGRKRHTGRECAVAGRGKNSLEDGDGFIELTEVRHNSCVGIESLHSIGRIFFDRMERPRAFDQSHGLGFVTQTGHDQREIIEDRPVVGLFLEEGLELSARGQPGVTRRFTIARNFLRPSEPEAQLAVEIANIGIGIGK